MPKIIMGEKKGKQYKIYIDEKYFGLIDKEIIEILKIKTDKIYSEEEIKKIKLNIKFEFAKKKALMLLATRPYCKKELEFKLERYVSKDIAKKTAECIKNLGLIDDYLYAENMAKKLIIDKKKGAFLAYIEIKKKGIDENIIKEVIDSLDYDPIEQIEYVILKKYVNKLENSNSKKKVIASLLRLGHSYENIIKTITNIKNRNYK